MPLLKLKSHFAPLKLSQQNAAKTVQLSQISQCPAYFTSPLAVSNSTPGHETYLNDVTLRRVQLFMKAKIKAFNVHAQLLS